MATCTFQRIADSYYIQKKWPLPFAQQNAEQKPGRYHHDALHHVAKAPFRFAQPEI
jgi:hypothetical protein